MDRVELKKQTCERLFGNLASSPDNPDQELMDILQNFMFGEAFHQGEMEDKKREMLTLVALTVNQMLPQLKSHVMAALRIGVTQAEIKETLYQCAPYIGFPKVLNAVQAANEGIHAMGMKPETIQASTVTEETRMKDGLAVQKSIFGEVIDKNYETAPDGQLHIQQYLSGMCFGDFYTRGVLDIKMRELITFCAILTMGGCENQLKAHIHANIKVGNSKALLVTAITQCLLYVGFPRTLNALACLNEIIPENE